VVVRGAGLAGCQGKPRAAAWRLHNGNPKGWVCCPPSCVITQSCTDVHSFALPYLARKQIPARATQIV